MSLAGHDPSRSIEENYLRFARQEARGRSRSYEILAAEVAGDPSVLAFLASLPPAKRQPNLLFAAARYLLGGPPTSPPSGRWWPAARRSWRRSSGPGGPRPTSRPAARACCRP